MVCQFHAAIPGQGLVELIRQLLRLLDERGDDGLRLLVSHLRQHHVARMPFDQRRDVAVLCAAQQIAFPMARHRTIFNRWRSFTDRYEIRYLSSAIAMLARLLRPADRSSRAKMLEQLFLQHATRLDEEASIDRLVRHVLRFILWI